MPQNANANKKTMNSSNYDLLSADVAIGAPWSGEGGRGQVFIYMGNSNGLSATPSQVIDSPLSSSRTAFGFTLRGGADVDGNGYPGRRWFHSFIHNTECQ